MREEYCDIQQSYHVEYLRGSCTSIDIDSATPETIASCEIKCRKHIGCKLIGAWSLERCIDSCADEAPRDAAYQECLFASSCDDIESCEPPSSEPPPPDEEPSEGTYRFVLVEDESSDDLDGLAPGADIDAIGIDIDGDQVIDAWASSVEDFNISGNNNEHTNPNELLGAPDSDCVALSFTSLGGDDSDNYVIVGFGNDVAFGPGAIIQVWELGPTRCPNPPEGRDDETTISVSVSDDRSSFERIGTTGNGTDIITIP